MRRYALFQSHESAGTVHNRRPCQLKAVLEELDPICGRRPHRIEVGNCGRRPPCRSIGCHVERTEEPSPSQGPRRCIVAREPNLPIPHEVEKIQGRTRTNERLSSVDLLLFQDRRQSTDDPSVQGLEWNTQRGKRDFTPDAEKCVVTHRAPGAASPSSPAGWAWC